MADDEQRAAIVAEELHEPGAGVDVEVVRRLVEQQHVAAGEQDAAELDPAALTARQDGKGEVDAVTLDAEAGDQRSHL